MTEEEQTAEFRKECDEWLAQFGYTLHSSSAQGRSLYYTHSDVQNRYPIIQCVFSLNGSKTVNLSYSGLMLFISLSDNNLQLKHPDMQQHIDAMRHYSDICKNNPYKL